MQLLQVPQNGSLALERLFTVFCNSAPPRRRKAWYPPPNSVITNFQTEVINLRKKLFPIKLFTNLSKNLFPPLSHLQTPTSLTTLAGPPRNPPKIHSQLPHPFFRTLTKDQHYFRTVPSNPLPVVLYTLFLIASAVQATLNLSTRATIRDWILPKFPITKTLARAIHNKIPSFSVCCLTFLFA
jgi:hypothetical protein